MTGEVDLLGNAHEIGGLYSKLQGALQAGVKQVLIPKNNEKDLDIIFMKEEENKNELIKSRSIKNIESFLLLEDKCYTLENNKRIFRNVMEIIMVENIFDVLKYALTENNIKFLDNY
jgi:predicted ATP-dependent protease